MTCNFNIAFLVALKAAGDETHNFQLVFSGKVEFPENLSFSPNLSCIGLVVKLMLGFTRLEHLDAMHVEVQVDQPLTEVELPHLAVHLLHNLVLVLELRGWDPLSQPWLCWVRGEVQGQNFDFEAAE